MVGSSIPTEVTGSAAKSLISGDYSRIVLTLGITGENDQAYELVNEVRSICAEQYGDTYYLTGTSVATSDVKDVAMSDAPTVKIASAVAIGIVLLIMLQSLSLPLILLLAIEASIWINFSVPYFMGSSLNYIGYLVVDAVQVGAAVDYAIILVHEYLGVRKKMPARQAAMESIARAATPLFTSSGILMLATLGVYFVSACPIDQQLGILICRGIFIADVIIFAVLPTLLVLFDRVIDKTSRRLDFFKPTKTNSAEKLSKSDA
jgi:predicted RND superfamily exporter protein